MYRTRKRRIIYSLIFLSILILVSITSFQFGTSFVPSSGTWYLDNPFGVSTYYIGLFDNGSIYANKGDTWENEFVDTDLGEIMEDINTALDVLPYPWWNKGTISFRTGLYTSSKNITVTAGVSLEGERSSGMVEGGAGYNRGTQIQFAENMSLIMENRSSIRQLSLVYTGSPTSNNYTLIIDSAIRCEVSDVAIWGKVLLKSTNYDCNFNNFQNMYILGSLELYGGHPYTTSMNYFEALRINTPATISLIGINMTGEVNSNTFIQPYLTCGYADYTAIQIDADTHDSDHNIFHDLFMDGTLVSNQTGIRIIEGNYNNFYISDSYWGSAGGTLWIDTSTLQTNIYTWDNITMIREPYIKNWISPHEYYLPLAYRIDAEGLIYYNDPYIVIRLHNETNHWISWLAFGKTFGFGQYEWKAKADNNETNSYLYLGGLEYHHGWYNEGIICLRWSGTEYAVCTTWSGGETATSVNDIDFTTERTITINWTSSYVEYYIDDVLKANHTSNVPQAPMQLFAEVGIGASAPTTEPIVYFRNKSFKEIG